MLRRLTLIALALGGAVNAQDPPRSSDADQIRSVIVRLNQARFASDAKAFSQLFTADGDLRLANEPVVTGRRAIESAFPKPPIWSEKIPPSIKIEAIRFVSGDVALVDAAQIQFGSLEPQSAVPVTIVMKLEGKDWRIVSMRIFPRYRFAGSPILSAP